MDIDLDAEWIKIVPIDKNSTVDRYIYCLDSNHPFGYVEGPFKNTTFTYRAFMNLGTLGVKSTVDIIADDLEGAKLVLENMVGQRIYDLGLAS